MSERSGKGEDRGFGQERSTASVTPHLLNGGPSGPALPSRHLPLIATGAIFIALFVYIGASQEAALAQMKDVSRRFPVSSAMVREFRTLLADATLEEAVDALLATSQHDFPVVDESGAVAGLLTRHDLISALRKNNPELRVGNVMRRDIPTVTTGTRFEDAFRIMQEFDCPAVPVLDRMKRLVGLLTPENVTELMMVQSAMPQRRVL